MTSRMRFHRDRDEQGVVLVLVTIMLVVICGFAALAIDLGNSVQTEQSAQDAADSAALSGAGELTTTAPSTVVTNVEKYVQENLPSYSSTLTPPWPSTYCPASAIPTGFTTVSGQNCISFNNNAVSPTAISVSIPALTVSYGFGKVVKHSGLAVSASATADIPDEGVSPCGLCVLGTSGTTLKATTALSGVSITDQGTAATANSSGIDVDSSGSGSTPAVNIGGFLDFVTSSSGFNVVGTANTGTCICNPNPTTGAAYVPDPLANLPLPSTAGTVTSALTITKPTTLSPGVYAGITVSGFTGVVTMNPGVYVILSGGFNVSGDLGTLNGNGVVLYFTCGTAVTGPVACNPGQSGGGFSVTSSAGIFNVSPPTATTCVSTPAAMASCPYIGLSVFYDRNNTAALTIGNPSASTFLTFSFVGSMYAKSANFVYTAVASVTFASLIVVGSFTMSGVLVGLSINYNPSQNIPVGFPALCSVAPPDNCAST